MPERENNSRMEIASLIDKELRAAFSLKRSLESELTKQETMSERVVVRKDLRECNRKIKELIDEDGQETGE
tara:strand:- start:233 stop:445 length:213 start_codon:yes stop_codon:yes gene_type:complete